MATWTAQRDGNWSTDASNVLSPWNGGGNPASGIPASGDTVNISNKTVTFDVDQSGFASGLASLTFAGGTLQASTSAGSYYLKMAGNITASAGGSYIKAGSSGTAYPSNCVFTIYFNGNYQINCNSSNYLTLELYCYEPVVKYAQLISATSKAITSITRGSTTTIGCTGHGYSAGNTIYFANVGGTTELNNQFFEVATVPGVDSFTIRWPVSDLAVDSTNFTAWTSGGLVCPQTAEAVSSTQIEIDQNVSADPEWNRAGAIVRINNVNRAQQSEAYTVSATTSTYLTLSSGLTNAKYAGSLAVLATRNVRINSSGTAISNGIIRYGSGHVLGCEIRPGSASTTGIQNATAMTNSAVITGCSSAESGNTSITVSNGVFSGNSNTFNSANVYTISGIVVAGDGSVLNGSFVTLTGSLISGCNTLLNAGTGITIENTIVANSTFLLSSSPTAFVLDNCYFFNNSRVVSGAIAGVFLDCYLYGNSESVVFAGGVKLLNCQVVGSSSGLSRGSGLELVNCQFAGNTYDVNGVNDLRAYNTLFNGTTEYYDYGPTSSTRTLVAYSESVYHDQVAGAYKAWAKGGIVTKQTTTYPTGYTYSFDHALESATAYCFWQQAVTVPAGGGLVVECLIRKDASMSYLPRLWLLLPGVEPLISGSPSYEAIMTNSVDTWETLLLVYANATTADVQITVRTIGQNATGHVYALPIVTVLAPATYDVYSTLQADITTILDRTPVLVGGRVDANVGSISGDTTAADNAEAFFDGTGYAGTNNTIPTVTTVNGFATDSLTAAALSAGAVAEIQSGLATAASIAALPTAASIVEAILTAGVADYEDDADAASLTELILAALESSRSATTWTIRKTDGTTFGTRTLTLDADADPVTGVT